MTNQLDNWEEEFDKEFPCVQVRLDPEGNDELVKQFIKNLLQAQREKEQQRILKLIVTDYTQSGYGDLIPADWEGFKKEILNQSNNNEESHQKTRC